MKWPTLGTSAVPIVLANFRSILAMPLAQSALYTMDVANRTPHCHVI